MLAIRITRHLRLHRWINTLPRYSNTWYRSVLCIIITIAYTFILLIANTKFKKKSWRNQLSEYEGRRFLQTLLAIS